MTASLLVSLEEFKVGCISEEYIRWLNDKEVMRYTDARLQHHTLRSVTKYVESTNDDYSRLYRILVSGQHVGNLRISAISKHHKRAEIAILIGNKEYWGKGVATKAIDLGVLEAFNSLGLHKITAVIYANNPASIRAFEKAGFHQDGRLKNHLAIDNDYVDAIYMARFSY